MRLCYPDLLRELPGTSADKSGFFVIGATMQEKQIEDFLYEHPELFIIIRGWYGRQVRVHSGVIDLLGYNKFGVPMVVELKHGGINTSAITQVCRYAYDVGCQITTALNSEQEYSEPFIMKTLVCTEIPGRKILREAGSLSIAVLVFNEDTHTLRNSMDFVYRKYNECYGIVNPEIANDVVYKYINGPYGIGKREY
jgi:hypothetical protein